MPNLEVNTKNDLEFKIKTKDLDDLTDETRRRTFKKYSANIWFRMTGALPFGPIGIILAGIIIGGFIIWIASFISNIYSFF